MTTVDNTKPATTPPIAVTGVGVVSAAGVGAKACLDALVAGRDLLTTLPAEWARPPHHLGACIGDVDFREWIPPRRLRRMNTLSRMAVVAAMQARHQAGLVPSPSTGAVIGTGLGALADTVAFVEQILDADPSQANPGLFPATVMNVAAAQISMELGLQGFNTTVNHKEISGELAMMLASDALKLGRADGLFCGGVDELTRPVHHGYRRLGGLASGRPRPYGAGRDGVVLGEGAAVLLLEPEEKVKKRGGRILARVAGVSAAGGERPLLSWGPGPVQGRVVGPAFDAGIAAVEGALADAGLTPDDVDLVIGSGCGSRLLDRLDATVLDRVFAPRAVPVTSLHGALGFWMASGALRLAMAVEVLMGGGVFAAGNEPDPEVSLPGLVVGPSAEDASVSVVLVCGHATGGGSAAVVLTSAEAG